jgi:hypothetical protein
VPKRRWIEVELTGAIPEGPAFQLSLGGSITMGSNTGFFAHHVPEPEPIQVTRTGRFRLGPIGHGRRQLQLFAPSRTRSATGTTIELGEVDPDRGPTSIALPQLTTSIVQGRVVLPKSVPTERIAVLATSADGKKRMSLFGDRPNVAGIAASGKFAIDMPKGSYCLQLVDLETGIIFHTEEEDRTIGDDVVVLRPEIHWLEIECAPQNAGDEAILQSFAISLSRPRNGARSALLRHGSRRNNVETGWVEFGVGATVQRWLLPKGEIQIAAQQTFEILKPWSTGWSSEAVATASLDIDKPEQRIRLAIPPPPSDEELMQRK